MEGKKEKLISLIPDCLSDLLYYDRKECEVVSTDDVRHLFDNKLITKEELVDAFSKALDDCFKD